MSEIEGGFAVIHFMDEHLLDACGVADRQESLHVTPVIEDVTCTPCGRIARKSLVRLTPEALEAMNPALGNRETRLRAALTALGFEVIE